MRFRNLFCISVLVSIAGAQAFAQGGGEGSKGGGGGDVEQASDHTMWFSGIDGTPQPEIRICLQSTEQFGLPDDAVKKAIVKAFKQWQFYYATRTEFPTQTAGTLQFIERCDGREDLKFYLGTSSPEVEQAKLKYDHPYALVERTSFSQGRGRGFVWFANQNSVEIDGRRKFPNWSADPKRFFGALLHEIGHIYGCGHFPETIMREDLWFLVAGGGLPRMSPDDLMKIDHRKELSRDFSRSDLAISLRRTGGPANSEILQKFLPAGTQIGESLKLTSTQPWQPDGYNIDAIVYLPNLLSLDAGGKSYSIPIENLERSGGSYSDQKAFKRGRLLYSVQKSELLSGVATTLSGEKVLVQIEYNLDQWRSQSPWAVFMIQEGKRVQIAESVK